MLFQREDDGQCAHDELGGRPFERDGMRGFQCPKCKQEVVYPLDDSGQPTGRKLLVEIGKAKR